MLTAHHADDQIETVLFRVLRGTGLDGLSGIHRRLVLDAGHGKPVPILRPMLSIARKRIQEYVDTHQLAFFQDPTNHDLRIQRNHIRHEVLPALETHFPQVKNALFRLSLVTEGDLHIIEESVNTVEASVLSEDSEGPYMDALTFNQLGEAWQRRILKRFLARQGVHVDFEAIEDFLVFIRGEGRRNLNAALKSLLKNEAGQTRFLALYKGKLRIRTPEPLPETTTFAIGAPGHLPLPAFNRTWTIAPWREPEKVLISPIRPHDSRHVFVDLSAYADKPLDVRTRRPGDRFQPMGMSAPLRFKKYLINRGVPRFERDRMLLLASGNQILWAPGLGISEQVRVAQSTAFSPADASAWTMSRAAPPVRSSRTTHTGAYSPGSLLLIMLKMMRLAPQCCQTVPPTS